MVCAGVASKKKVKQWSRAMKETRVFPVEESVPVGRAEWLSLALEELKTDPYGLCGEVLEGLGFQAAFLEFYSEARTENMLKRMEAAKHIGKDLIHIADDDAIFEKFEDFGVRHFIDEKALDALSDAGLRRLLDREAMECISNERRVLLGAARRAVAKRVAVAFANATTDDNKKEMLDALMEQEEHHVFGGIDPLDVANALIHDDKDPDKDDSKDDSEEQRKVELRKNKKRRGTPAWLLGLALDVVPPSRVYVGSKKNSAKKKSRRSTMDLEEPPPSPSSVPSPSRGMMEEEDLTLDRLPATEWRRAMGTLSKIGSTAREDDVNVRFALYALERAADLADEIDRDLMIVDSVDLTTTAVRRDLADAYRFSGRVDDAIKYDRKVLGDLAKLEADDRQKARAYFKLAESLTAKARIRLAMGFAPENLPEARELYDKALAIYDDLVGPNHLDRSDILHGLAHVMSLQDPTGKADSEKMGREALQISREHRGLRHPLTLEMQEDWDPNDTTGPFRHKGQKINKQELQVVHIPNDDLENDENNIDKEELNHQGGGKTEED